MRITIKGKHLIILLFLFSLSACAATPVHSIMRYDSYPNRVAMQLRYPINI